MDRFLHPKRKPASQRLETHVYFSQAHHTHTHHPHISYTHPHTLPHTCTHVPLDSHPHTCPCSHTHTSASMLTLISEQVSRVWCKLWFWPVPLYLGATPSSHFPLGSGVVWILFQKPCSPCFSLATVQPGGPRAMTSSQESVLNL